VGEWRRWMKLKLVLVGVSTSWHAVCKSIYDCHCLDSFCKLPHLFLQ
jgi:hypothetical protein